MPLALFLYAAAFIAIWIGAGLIVKTVDLFSRRLKISPFSVSFFILGVLTSIPEFAVGLTSVAQSTPDIFIGNLLGGIVVLFLLAIPLLAILGHRVALDRQFDRPTLLGSLLIIGSPALFLLDGKVTFVEGLVLVLLYLLLFFFLERRHGLLDSHSRVTQVRSYSGKDIFLLLLGIALVIISGRTIVSQTIYLSGIFKIPTSVISLTLLALGTNLPELSLIVRSVAAHKKSIALGDYIGSAAANTLIFGFLVILNRGDVIPSADYYLTPLFILLAFTLFYFFTRKDKVLSRLEATIMLLMYFFFILVEFTSV